MTVPAAVHPQGSRVRVRRGRLPMDPTLVGRAGTVVELSDYRWNRSGVVLDGEDTVREFKDDELERAEG